MVSAEEAATRISPSAGVLEPVDAGSCLLTSGAVSLDVLVIHVLMTGFDFAVVEPPELTARIRAARDLLTSALRRSEHST